MDNEAAVSLLMCSLEKRGTAAPKKKALGLTAYGCAKGFFKTPDSYFDEAEWWHFSNALWNVVIDG